MLQKIALAACALAFAAAPLLAQVPPPDPPQLVLMPPPGTEKPEDVGEPPYRIDRMLTQLLQGETLTHAAGICLGDFHVKGHPLGHPSPEVERVLHDRLRDLAIPVAHGFPFGHRPRSWTLPFGGRARLEAKSAGDAVQLRLLEAVVE